MNRSDGLRAGTGLLGGLLVAVCTLACSDDTTAGPTRDAEPVLSLDAYVDHFDASDGLDATAACRLDQAYSFTEQGSLLGRNPTSQLDPSGAYSRVTVSRLIDAGVQVEVLCASRLGACGASEVDVAELSAAFAASDVVAAFERGARFGTSDEFNSDATPAVIERADGKRFVSGRQCVAPCTPIPPGVVTLLALLRRLEAEQRASGPCQGT